MSSVRSFTHDKCKSQYLGFHFTHIPKFKESQAIINILKAKAATSFTKKVMA